MGGGGCSELTATGHFEGKDLTFLRKMSFYHFIPVLIFFSYNDNIKNYCYTI